MFRYLKYALKGRQKKNPFSTLWYAIRKNREEMNYKFSEIHLDIEAVSARLKELEAKPKRGRPKKST